MAQETLPSGMVVSTTGNASYPFTEALGGAVVGVTDKTNTAAGQPVTTRIPFKDNAVGENHVDTKPKELTSTNSTSNQRPAYSAGTFAYNQVQFMAQMVATKINNVANTSLQIGGQTVAPPHRSISNKSKGAKTSTAWRARNFNWLGIAGQRTNWSSAPATNNVDYVLPTDNTTAAADHAIFVTYKAVPGELTYMDGAPNPIQDQYKARGFN
jgi:hypothetical protein